MSRSLLQIVLLSCFLLLAVTACNDDDSPTCPGQDLRPAMANIWPHADGNIWFFEGGYSEFPPPETGGTGRLDDLPLPSMADLHADLQHPVAGEPDLAVNCLYRLSLDGEITTDTGVSAQHLAGRFYFPQPGGGDTVRGPESGGDPLLRLIARVRPDLREAALARMSPGARKDISIDLPLSLGDYAFAYEDSGYFGYGDLDTGHSWVYLAGSLEAGTEFSHQLVPSIADDVWLHGRVWSRGDLTVGGRLYRNAVEVMYVVDLGESDVVDENGDPIGVFRSYIYGTVHYVPGVGPVKGLERHVEGPNQMDGSESGLITDYVMDLVSASTGEG